MRFLALAGLAAILLAGCATQAPAPIAAAQQLAPSGTLRAAINVGNAVLARRSAD